MTLCFPICDAEFVRMVKTNKEPVNSISASQDYCANHVRIQMGKSLVWAQVALCYSNHVNFTLSIIQPTSFITERPTIKSTKKRNGQIYLSERVVFPSKKCFPVETC